MGRLAIQWAGEIALRIVFPVIWLAGASLLIYFALFSSEAATSSGGYKISVLIPAVLGLLLSVYYTILMNGRRMRTKFRTNRSPSPHQE